MKFFYLSVLIIAMTSCFENSTTKTESSTSDQVTVITNDNTTDTTNNSNGSNSSSTSGTTSGAPTIQIDMLRAGHQSWYPLYANEDDTSDDNDLLSAHSWEPHAAGLLFQSDSNGFQMRFRVNSQPFTTTGEEYCPGRALGQAADTYRYTKLRFQVALRDVYCIQRAGAPSYACIKAVLGPKYATKFVDPISVGSYSDIIDLSASRNIGTINATIAAQYPTAELMSTTIEVNDVKSDSACQEPNGSYYCPSERIVRAASCWHMTMELKTSNTGDFSAVTSSTSDDSSTVVDEIVDVVEEDPFMQGRIDYPTPGYYGTTTTLLYNGVNYKIGRNSSSEAINLLNSNYPTDFDISFKGEITRESGYYPYTYMTYDVIHITEVQ